MQSVPVPATTPIRVAVVEDDDSFRAAFVAAIDAAPDTEVAAIATLRSEALALLQGPPADVLLVDLGLPDGSGIDVIRAAEKAWPGCNVVVTTIFADEDHFMQCIESGAVGYLLKDSHPEHIVQEIRSLHQGGSPISPQIARRVLQRLRAPLVESQPIPWRRSIMLRFQAAKPKCCSWSPRVLPMARSPSAWACRATRC